VTLCRAGDLTRQQQANWFQHCLGKNVTALGDKFLPKTNRVAPGKRRALRWNLVASDALKPPLRTAKVRDTLRQSCFFRASSNDSSHNGAMPHGFQPFSEA
jgi:hypothetical protein